MPDQPKCLRCKDQKVVVTGHGESADLVPCPVCQAEQIKADEAKTLRKINRPEEEKK